MKRIRLALGLLIGIVLMVSIGRAQDARRIEYKIGAKDVLSINIPQMEELKDLTVRVTEEGSITLPLLGEVRVEGLTSGDLERRLAELLLEKEILRDAQVTVYIKEYQSQRVSVLGAVKEPSSYEIIGRQSLLQIISEAGGLTEEAGTEIIIIRQTIDGGSTTLKIPVDKLMAGDAGLNIPMQAGDIINIPVDKEVQIFVLGQVKNSGALKVKRSRIPTLLQAIAMAGGFSERAQKKNVIIKWTDAEGKDHQRQVNVKDIISGKIKDIQLKEEDTVIVKESLF